jgi:hypothetical protein
VQAISGDTQRQDPSAAAPSVVELPPNCVSPGIHAQGESPIKMSKSVALKFSQSRSENVSVAPTGSRDLEADAALQDEMVALPIDDHVETEVLAIAGDRQRQSPSTAAPPVVELPQICVSAEIHTQGESHNMTSSAVALINPPIRSRTATMTATQPTSPEIEVISDVDVLKTPPKEDLVPPPPTLRRSSRQQPKNGQLCKSPTIISLHRNKKTEMKLNISDNVNEKQNFQKCVKKRLKI